VAFGALLLGSMAGAGCGDSSPSGLCGEHCSANAMDPASGRDAPAGGDKNDDTHHDDGTADQGCGLCGGQDNPMTGGDGDGVGDGDGNGAVTDPDDGPPAGNGDGACPVPDAAKAVDSSTPTTVVGTGTKESCTSAAFVAAVAKGGVIKFNCGAEPATIVLEETAKVYNDAIPDVVIDGENRITLSGNNQHRILYQNTCDANVHLSSPTCNDQDYPRLTVQNLTLVDGNAADEADGGGAIFVQGGQLKIVNSRFFHNHSGEQGPDIGGGAVRVLSFNGLPVYVNNSTFGGDGELGNWGANGGALSGLFASYTIINSKFLNNRATGDGGNPAKPNTVGGGSGGAIYNDGNTFTLTVCGTQMTDNHAGEYGGAIFFVSNNRTGDLIVDRSQLSNNVSEDAAADQYPGIFVLEKDEPDFPNSTID
jgi:hypothetical protein